MKRHSRRGSTAILALSTFLLLPALALAAEGKPKAVIAEAIKDLGTVPKGEKVTHDFVLKNEGTATLEITNVRPACGCTVAEFDKTIAPGKTGVVHTVLDTATFAGPVSKGVTVFTNDPDNPQLQLTLQAKVEPFIAVKPGYARFSVVQGEEKEGEIVQTMWATDGAPFSIVKVDTEIPGIATSFRETTEAERRPEAGQNKQWRVSIKLSNGAPVGPLANYVNIHTDHPKQKIVQIPISGFVRPVMAATPPIADFGPIEVKEPLTKSLNVRNFASEPIKITNVEGNVKGIDAKIEPLEEGREYTVRLTVSPDAAKGPFAGKLLVHTDSKKVPVLTVDLRGTVL